MGTLGAMFGPALAEVPGVTRYFTILGPPTDGMTARRRYLRLLVLAVGSRPL